MHRHHVLTSRVLVLLLLLGTTPWHTEDTADHRPALQSHDASAHRVRTPANTTGDEHCAVCHWLQSLRTARVGQVRTINVERTSRIRAVGRWSALLGTALLHLPPRSPPA